MVTQIRTLPDGSTVEVPIDHHHQCADCGAEVPCLDLEAECLWPGGSAGCDTPTTLPGLPRHGDVRS